MCTRAVVKAKLNLFESCQSKMSEEEKTEELPKIDKKLMKEALQEILNDIPAFQAFAQHDKGEKTIEDSSKTETVTPGPSGAQSKDGKGKHTNANHA